MESIDLAFRILSLSAQIAVPVAIFFAGRSIAKAQFVKSAQDAWNEFNKLVVHNADNVRVGRENFSFTWAAESDDAFRKAHMGFVALNAFTTVFYGAKHGLLPVEYKNNNVEQILRIFLADDQIYELTQTRGYAPEFRDLCKKMKQEIGGKQ